MPERFAEQSGAATMDPHPLRRWLTSKLLSRIARPARLAQQRVRVEQNRHKANQPHSVEYFHQVDDGYSHLAAQVLEPLAKRYDIELVCHLVSGLPGKNNAEPELLLRHSRRDAHLIAAHYQLEFPDHEDHPQPALVTLAERILAAQDSNGFIRNAADVGRALWSDDEARMLALAGTLGCVANDRTQACIQTGNARRDQLKHYSSAMFYYGREWYWGVDRLYHLENRLAQLAADRQPGESILMPRPVLEIVAPGNSSSLTLEFYPSLRSPYTAIVFDRTIKLAQATGVRLAVRPVLPMVMRCVPATREKGMYIFCDAAREAAHADVPYGDFYDPIGDPVRRCYSLYPWACEQGRGNELLSAFLRAAFAEGINTSTGRGLRQVVEKAGLDWQLAKKVLGSSDWNEVLENNRLAMYGAGLWGVPSFRLLNQAGKELLVLWGQDRLWRVAHEIHYQSAAVD